MNLEQLLDSWRSSPQRRRNITHWHTQEAVPAEYAPLPDALNPRLAAALRAGGIEKLYSHQAAAFDAIAADRHTCIVTPTASGKTLCYTLPVINAILQDDGARALYLFPTKALAQDQSAVLRRLTGNLPPSNTLTPSPPQPGTLWVVGAGGGQSRPTPTTATPRPPRA